MNVPKMLHYLCCSTYRFLKITSISELPILIISQLLLQNERFTALAAIVNVFKLSFYNIPKINYKYDNTCKFCNFRRQIIPNK